MIETGAKLFFVAYLFLFNFFSCRNSIVVKEQMTMIHKVKELLYLNKTEEAEYTLAEIDTSLFIIIIPKYFFNTLSNLKSKKS